MSDEQKLLAACVDYRAKLDALERENAALREELEAEAVVNGAGYEREAKLLTEIAAIKIERNKTRVALKHILEVADTENFIHMSWLVRRLEAILGKDAQP